MKPISILAHIACACILASAVAACGQRGPLYMPGSAPPKHLKKNDPVQLPQTKSEASTSAKLGAAAPTPSAGTSAADKP